MRVLALNCGSSSVKSALVDTDTSRRLFEARIEEIGKPACQLRSGERTTPLDAAMTLEAAVTRLEAQVRAVSARTGPAEAVSHRVVHGGAKFVHPTLLDEQTLRMLDELAALAPLHNPPAVAAIRIMRKALPGIPHVAVFDTAFHATLADGARASTRCRVTSASGSASVATAFMASATSM